jgi:hypothetical protein
MLIVAAYLGWHRRYSFVEVISAKLDRAFFEMLARYGFAPAALTLEGKK